MVETSHAMDERTCESCSLCCYLLGVKQFEKPSGVWCRHCRPGDGGCTIYPDRPRDCHWYECEWLQGMVGDEWFPQRAHIVLSYRWRSRSVSVSVDPKFPDRWREEPYFTQLCQMSMKNRMRIYIGDEELFVLHQGKLTQRRRARLVRLVF